MSGGQYDYFCFKIGDFADSLKTNTPLRKCFRDLLKLVENAAYDIEWVDSGDKSEGDEEESIKKCFVCLEDLYINNLRRERDKIQESIKKFNKLLEGK